MKRDKEGERRLKEGLRDLNDVNAERSGEEERGREREESEKRV